MILIVPSIPMIPKKDPFCNNIYMNLTNSFNLLKKSYESNIEALLLDSIMTYIEQSAKLTILINSSIDVSQNCIDTIVEQFNTTEVQATFIQCVGSVEAIETSKVTLINNKLEELRDSTLECDSKVRLSSTFFFQNFCLINWFFFLVQLIKRIYNLKSACTVNL